MLRAYAAACRYGRGAMASQTTSEAPMRTLTILREAVTASRDVGVMYRRALYTKIYCS